MSARKKEVSSRPATYFGHYLGHLGKKERNQTNYLAMSLITSRFPENKQMVFLFGSTK